MLVSKSPPHSKQERFSDLKRYLESSQQVPTGQIYAGGASNKAGNRNPYLSPISLTRLQQLQLGKRFLRDMKNGAMQPLYSALHSPQNKSLTSGVPSIHLPPKRNPPPGRYPEVDASHGVTSFQLPVRQSSRSQSKHKKAASASSRGGDPLIHQHAFPPHKVSPLSANLTCETRLSPNATRVKLYLQPWSIYYIPGEDPNTFQIPPARKIAPNEKIERELKDFKREIDEKFAKTPMKHFVFPRTEPQDPDDSFLQFGDDIAVVSDDQEPDHHPPPAAARKAPPPRSILSSGSSLRGATKPSPLRPGVLEGIDKRVRSSRSSSKDGASRGSGAAAVATKNAQKRVPASYFKPAGINRPQPKLVPQSYSHSQAVAALVSPTTRAYEKKLVRKEIGLSKDISFERKNKRKKLKLADLNSTADYGLIKRSSSNLSPQYPGTVIPSARAWEEHPVVPMIAKPKTHGGGTGAPLTPPPNVLNEQDGAGETQKHSPRGMTHRSFLIPGQKADRQLLSKTGAHTKSQHHKHKFTPGGGIGPPGQQAFIPATTILKKTSHTPREQAPPPSMNNPSPISQVGSVKPPSGGTGSITSHQQQQQNTNSNSYRSLRHVKSNSHSRKPQPLSDIAVPMTPTRGQLQTGKPGAYSAQPRLLPPEMIQSVYLQASPQARMAISAKNAARGTYSTQQHYSQPSSTSYHGNWSILGAGKEPAVYISHETVKKQKVGATTTGHTRAKTSHIESSQTQLDTEGSKNSGRKGAKRKKNSKNSFDFNDSFDTRQALHTNTLSRELNMINRELQNADQTMKLLVDAQDLKLGYLKAPMKQAQQVVGLTSRLPHPRNLALKSPQNVRAPGILAGMKANTPSARGGGGHGIGGGIGGAVGQKGFKNIQEQYKRRFKVASGGGGASAQPVFLAQGLLEEEGSSRV